MSLESRFSRDWVRRHYHTCKIKPIHSSPDKIHWYGLSRCEMALTFIASPSLLYTPTTVSTVRNTIHKLSILDYIRLVDLVSYVSLIWTCGVLSSVIIMVGVMFPLTSLLSVCVCVCVYLCAYVSVVHIMSRCTSSLIFIC